MLRRIIYLVPGTLAVDGWAVILGTARSVLGGAALRSSPWRLLAVLNATAHPSTASVTITVLLYNGPLLCGFNVPIRGLTTCIYPVIYSSLVLFL